MDARLPTLLSRFCLVFFPLGALTAIGCQSPRMADRGAGIGAMTGALAGAAIGEGGGDAASGALLGAGIGAMSGAMVGGAIDEEMARRDAYIEQRIGRRVAGTASLEDVMAMSQAGLSDAVIIAHIRSHGIARAPSAQDLIRLAGAGVSDPVIQTLQQPAPPAVIEERPVVIERVVEAPIWAPPTWRYRHHRHWNSYPSVGWGFHFHHGGP